MTTPIDSPTVNLSPTRQADKDLTAKGRTPREIANKLNISTQRVYHHLKKLGLEPAKQSKASCPKLPTG
mgnify:CR=1 FL=1